MALSRQKRLYMKVTNDDLELPLAVADSFEELAEMLGISKATIYSERRYAKANGIKSQFVRMVIKE